MSEEVSSVQHLTVEQVAQKYKTNLNLSDIKASSGLNDAQVQENRSRFGWNKLPEPKRPSLFRAYLSYLQNLFSVMLIICGFLSLSLYPVYPSDFSYLYVGLTLVLVSFFNAFLEFYQKYKSEELLKGFMNLVPDNAYVRRNGSIQEISAVDVVPGDLLLLRLGDKIAADGRVIHASELKVDNSILTGESEPVDRITEVQGREVTMFEARNVVFSGTTVASGEGLAVVFGVGRDTEIGRLSQLNEASNVTESQLSKEMTAAVRGLVTAGLLTGTTLMIVSFSQGFGLAVSFEIAIGSYLAFLPQGLPATITSLLTVAATRMAKKNVLVKNLQGVETLGAITLLATDKTGTLTMNRMDVVSIWDCSKAEEKDGCDFNEDILKVCKFCSNVRELEGGRLLGDATEQGIYRFIKSIEQKFNFAFAEEKRQFEIPFSSATKWHLVVNDKFIYMKGAPERVFTHCKYKKGDDGQIVPIDDGFRGLFDRIYANLGSKGLRVLAVAGRPLRHDDDKTDFDALVKDDLIMYGLIGLQDPPKPGVKESIKRLKGAGIRVVMVTGDHPLTAGSISKQIGLLSCDPEDIFVMSEKNRNDYRTRTNFRACVIHGELIDTFEERDWERVIKAEEVVFARTQPKHKLAIVKAFQEYGHVVAVSGDGANDSPALKTADLGISMNRTASDVSKEAADMILLDDNFNTILAGIAEGRLIFENLKKSVRYTLTHITAEISSLGAVAIAGIPFPIPALLILVFDVFCEVGPAMSYATEPAPIDFLKLKPRKIPRLKKMTFAEGTVSKNDVNPWQRFKNLYRVKIEGETLTDRETILWAFFQGGVFIAIGAFSAYILTMIWNSVPLSSLWRSVNIYFESQLGENIQPLKLTTGAIIGADAQSEILQKAESAFFLALIMGQWFNLFLTKHRYRYPHGWDIFRNKSTYLGMLTSGTIAASVVFIPGLQAAFNTSTIDAIAIAPPVVTGILLVLYEYPRRYIYFRMKNIKTRKLL